VTRSGGTAFLQSVHDRLMNAAMGAGRPFAELLELFAVERFLHRLGCSPQRDRFVLKGALLLREWLGADTRPTHDIDLLGPADLDEHALRDAIADVLRAAVDDDGISFDTASIVVRPIRAGSAVLGLRAKFDACLGRTRLRYQIDVGLGDSLYPPAVEVVPGRLLGLPMASVRAYTPYTTVAEKLEAVVVLGNANSRTKDYFDLLRLPHALAFSGPTLVESIRRTFARRVTSIPTEPLEGLSDEFGRDPLHAGRWGAFLRKAQLKAPEADFPGVIKAIRQFAQPVLDAARDGTAFECDWKPRGPWR